MDTLSDTNPSSAWETRVSNKHLCGGGEPGVVPPPLSLASAPVNVSVYPPLHNMVYLN